MVQAIPATRGSSDARSGGGLPRPVKQKRVASSNAETLARRDAAPLGAAGSSPASGRAAVDVVLDHVRERVAQPDLRLPAEQGARVLDVGHPRRDVLVAGAVV